MMELSEKDKGRLFKYLQEIPPVRKFLDALNLLAFVVIVLMSISAYRYMDDLAQLAFQSNSPELILEDVVNNIPDLSKAMQNNFYVGAMVYSVDINSSTITAMAFDTKDETLRNSLQNYMNTVKQPLLMDRPIHKAFIRAIIEKKAVWVDRKVIDNLSGYFVVIPIPPVRGIISLGFMVVYVLPKATQDDKNQIEYIATTWAYNVAHIGQ